MSSIKQTRERMVVQKRGLPIGANTTSNTLRDLKGMLDSMYNVRANPKSAIGGEYASTVGQDHNKEVPPTANSGVSSIGKIIPNYTEFQGSIKKSPNAMSIGDYNRALDSMSNCTCDARMSAGCTCVSVNDGIVCNCNARTSYTCDCVSRSGGKYDSSCTCNSVYVGCSCEARTSQFICSCNTRCSCNAVREFS